MDTRTRTATLLGRFRTGRFLAVAVGLLGAAAGLAVADDRAAVFFAVAGYFAGKTAGSVRRVVTGPEE